jgi:hypothetical protein
MPIRFALLVVYLAYALASGGLTKHGSGLDPVGAPPLSATPNQPAADQGSGWDPWG